MVANRRLWGEGLRARARRAGQLRGAALTSPVGWILPSTGSRGAPQALGNGAVEVVHQRPPREKVTSGVQAGGGAVTRPFSSNLPLFCAQGKTYSFSLGNFAWDGFLAVAPQGRSGEKRFHSNAGAAVGALLVSPPRGGHPGKWEEDRPRIESAWASCALTGWDRGGVGRGRLGLQREQTPLMVGVGGGGKGPGEIISGLETGCQGKVKDPVKT